MSCQILKGAPAAAALDENTIIEVQRLKAAGVEPCLAIVRVGEKENDLAYERGALKRCAKTGIAVRQVILPENAAQADLIDRIRNLNADPGVHGILLFRPLPKTFDEAEVCRVLAPQKDVDGITAGSQAKMFSGSGDGFAPCTAQSCMELLKYYGIKTAGKRVVVVGRSLVIGRPAAMLLLQADATVTMCHTKTLNLPETIRAADIVIAAAGKAEILSGDCFRDGQIVLDVGVNWSERRQKLVGDVDEEAAAPLVEALTPVPGGVGAVTTAVLASHVAEAARRQSVKK